MSLSQTSVLKLYNTVIEDVIAGVRESFLDDGVDEQVLMELKQVWESKLMASKAVEKSPDPPEPQPPQLPTPKSGSNKGGGAGQGSSSAGSSKSQSQQKQQQQQQQQQQVVIPKTQQQQVQPQQQQQQKQQQQQQQQQQNRPPVLQSTPAPQQIQQHVNMPVQQAQTPVTLFERQVPIQITLPGNAATNDKPKVLTIQVPASAIQGNQLPAILTGQVITAAMGFPPDIASRMLQQHVDKTLQGQASITINQPMQVIRQEQGNIAQMDGEFGETSDDDDDDDKDDSDDDDDLDDDKDEEDNDDAGAREEEPLNSEDDVTDEDPTDLFETENVVVCQYDKITRSRNKWKFYLKDGIMNLEGKDYVFQKANGDAEW